MRRASGGNALGMGSGDLLAAHNNAAFPGTSPWEQLSAGQASGIAPGAMEAAGTLAQVRQQTHEKDIQSLQLDQERLVQSNANLASVVSHNADKGPAVLNAAMSAYTQNQTLQPHYWQMSREEYRGFTDIQGAQVDLAILQWDWQQPFLEARTQETNARTDLIGAQEDHTRADIGLVNQRITESKASTVESRQRADLIGTQAQNIRVDTAREQIGLELDMEFARTIGKEQVKQIIKQTAIQAIDHGIRIFDMRIADQHLQLAQLKPGELQAQIDMIRKQVEWFERDRINAYAGTIITGIGGAYVGTRVLGPALKAKGQDVVNKMTARQKRQAAKDKQAKIDDFIEENPDMAKRIPPTD